MPTENNSRPMVESEKSKVLFILHLPPPIHGAAIVGQYIRGSGKINKTFEGSYINLSTSSTLVEIGKSSFQKFLKIASLPFVVLYHLLLRKYDLCYITLSSRGTGFYKDLVVVALLKLFNKNVIYHFHNRGVKESEGRLLQDSLYRFAFRNVKCILLSRNLYSDVERYVKPGDVFFCPNGTPNTNPLVHSQAASPRFPVRLLFLSNMMKEKGVYTLLETCSLLLKRNLSFECHFVGAWSDITPESFGAQVKSFGLSKILFAHGKVVGREKDIFYEESDIFIHPTHNDAFPLVILEAMQYSLPVVSTFVGGIPDIVVHGKTGFLVQKEDAVALADQLEILIKDENLRGAFASEARRRFENQYTLEKFEDKFVECLKLALN